VGRAEPVLFAVPSGQLPVVEEVWAQTWNTLEQNAPGLRKVVEAALAAMPDIAQQQAPPRPRLGSNKPQQSPTVARAGSAGDVQVV
jgi:hypothetical protein